MTDSTEDTSADTENDSDNEDLENEDSDSEETAQEENTAAEKFETLKEISLKETQFQEKDIQEFLAKHPDVLGLGNIEKTKREIRLEGGIFLDILYYNDTKKQYYAVETQLGQIDPSHIFRALEYREKLRISDYKYNNCCAVLVAENTNRYSSIISCFDSKKIQFILIKMQAYEKDGRDKENDPIILTFTKILDTRSHVDIDEDDNYEKKWKKMRRSHKFVEKFFEILKGETKIKEETKPKYTKHYIGVSIDGTGSMFVSLKQTRSTIDFRPKIARGDEIDNEVKAQGLHYSYNHNFNYYVIKLKEKDFPEKEEFIKKLILKAYKKQFS